MAPDNRYRRPKRPVTPPPSEPMVVAFLILAAVMTIIAIAWLAQLLGWI